MSEFPELSILGFRYVDEVKALDLDHNEFVSVSESAQGLLGKTSESAQNIARLIAWHQVNSNNQALVSEFWEALQRQCKRFDSSFDAKKVLLPYLEQNPEYTIDVENSRIRIAQQVFVIEAEDFSPTRDELIVIAECLSVVEPEDLESMAKGIVDDNGKPIESGVRIVLMDQKNFGKKFGGHENAAGIFFNNDNILYLGRPYSVHPYVVLHEINHAIDDMRAPQDTKASYESSHPFYQHPGWRACKDDAWPSQKLREYSCTNIAEGLAEWNYYTGQITSLLLVVSRLLNNRHLSQKAKFFAGDCLAWLLLGSNQDIKNRVESFFVENVMGNPQLNPFYVLELIDFCFLSFRSEDFVQTLFMWASQNWQKLDPEDQNRLTNICWKCSCRLEDPSIETINAKMLYHISCGVACSMADLRVISNFFINHPDQIPSDDFEYASRFAELISLSEGSLYELPLEFLSLAFSSSGSFRMFMQKFWTRLLQIGDVGTIGTTWRLTRNSYDQMDLSSLREAESFFNILLSDPSLSEEVKEQLHVELLHLRFKIFCRLFKISL